MKKYLFYLLIFLNINVFSQTINWVSPSAGNKGEVLTVLISGTNVDFGSQYSNTLSDFRFTQFSSTTTFYGTSTSASGNSLYGELSVPCDAHYGEYDLEVYDNGTNSWVIGQDLFYVNFSTPQITCLSKNSTQQGDFLSVEISGTDFNFGNQYGTNPTVKFTQFSTTNYFYADVDSVNSCEIYGNVFVPYTQNTGFYDLEVYNNYSIPPFNDQINNALYIHPFSPPTIDAIIPNNAFAGQSLSVQISGTDINYGNSCDNNFSQFKLTKFNQFSGTNYEIFGSTTSFNGSELYGDISIPSNALIGLYDVNVWDHNDSNWVTKDDFFTIDDYSSFSNCVDLSTSNNFIDGFYVNSYPAAIDFSVSGNSLKTLTQVKLNFFSEYALNYLDIAIYEDNGGNIGSLLSNESIYSFVSQSIVGYNYGFPIYEVVIDFQDVNLINPNSSNKIFWFEVNNVSNNNGGPCYWEITDLISPSSIYDFLYDNDQGFMCNNGYCGFDGVYELQFACFSGCTDPLALNYDSLASTDDGSCNYCDLSNQITISNPTDSISCDGFGLVNSSSTYPIVSYQWLNSSGTIFSNNNYTFNLCNDIYVLTVIDSLGCLVIDTFSVGVNYGCTDSLFFEYDPFSTADDGSCLNLIIYGCTDLNAFNFNSNTNSDDGSCCYLSGCLDSNALNYNPYACYSDSSLCIPLIYGCTDPLASNYSFIANTNDGSCVPFLYGCVDSVAFNYDYFANTNDGSCLYCDLTNSFFTILNTTGNCDGLILSNPSSSYSPISYLWFNGNTSNNLTNLCAGLYVLTITDSVGCQVTDSVNMNVVLGCTDSTAENYDQIANYDDGSCYYCNGVIDSVVFNFTGTIETFTFPSHVNTLFIHAYGAQGGNNIGNGDTYYGGKGAYNYGEFSIIPNQSIQILVGEQPSGNGGGGGTFVVDPYSGPILISGGGGGASGTCCGNGFQMDGENALGASYGDYGTSGYNSGSCSNGDGGNNGNGGAGGLHSGGGGGYYSNGTDGTNGGGGGYAFLSGGSGGLPQGSAGTPGGFGGGAASYGNSSFVLGAGGGGGGYSGGGGNCGYDDWYNGGAGSSFNNGSNKYESSAYNNSNGKVVIYFTQLNTFAGCTDPNADNYDSLALCDDGSCYTCNLNYSSAIYQNTTGLCDGSIYFVADSIYGPVTYLWSLAGTIFDSTVSSYNVQSQFNLCAGTYTFNAIDSNGCIFSEDFVIGGVLGCTDSLSLNFDPLANIDDGSCIPFIYGCTDSTALNYFPGANFDDGSCLYQSNCTSPKPNGLYAYDVIDTRAKIGWNNMNSSDCMVLKYFVRYREVGTNGWTTKSAGVGNGLCVFGLNTVDKQLLNLSPSTTYEFKMKTFYCGGTSSNYSPVVQFTTSDVCPDMTNLSVQTFNNNTSKAKFTWDTTGAYTFARILLRVDTSGANWQTAGGFGVYYPTFFVNKFGLQSGESYRAQGRTFCDSNITAYRSPTWTSPIFWTQPGSIKLDGGVSINNLDVYPNPSRDLFNISFSSNKVQDLSVRILSVVGAEVYRDDKQQFVGEYTKQISLDNYGKGIYFLEIQTPKGIVNKKLILQ